MGAPFGGVTDITRGPDGAVWYTADWWQYSDGTEKDVVGRLAPDGTFTEFPVPAWGGFRNQVLGSITAGPDGNLWFVGSGIPPNGANYGETTVLYRMTPQGQLTGFQAPVPALLPPANVDASGHGVLAAGPDGNLWFATVGGICRFSPRGQFTLFTLPADISAWPAGQRSQRQHVVSVDGSLGWCGLHHA